jgi:3-methylcrotonyl-CoA carboxylase beta subunit
MPPAMRALVDDLNAKLGAHRAGRRRGPARQARRARQAAAARPRRDAARPDTPFLEVAPLAALGMYNDDAPGAG